MQLEFDARYSRYWHRISWAARAKTKHKCVLCGHKATQTHHAVYCDKEGRAIAGREIPGAEVFPLCDRCHEIAHDQKNWVRDNKNPVLGNRNTAKFWKKLRKGWERFQR